MAESLNEEQPQLPVSRGYAVLITNEVFPLINCNNAAYPGRKSNHDPTRKGADVDDSNLQYIFNTKLKLTLLENRTYMNVNEYPYKTSTIDHPFWIHSNPPIDKTKCRCISCKIQTTDHSQSECFVLAISTHGVEVKGEQEICFSDDLHVDRITLTDIIKTLNDDNCKTLKGKPRIILIQVCRHDQDVPKDKQDAAWHDKGHLVNVEATEESEDLTLDNLTIIGADNSRNESARNETRERAGGDFQDKTEAEEIEDTDMQSDSEEDSLYYLHGGEKALYNLPSDFLIVFPSVSGKKAVHNFTHGSWLIDELRKVVEKHDFKKYPNMNFLSVLTSAAGRVARDKEGKEGQKTAVCIVHRLLRPIIFNNLEDAVQEQPNLAKDKPALFN